MKKILIPLIIIASIVTIHAETISLKNFPEKNIGDTLTTTEFNKIINLLKSFSRNPINGFIGIGTDDPRTMLHIHSQENQGNLTISGASDKGRTYSSISLDDNIPDSKNRWSIVHKNETKNYQKGDFQIARWDNSGKMRIDFTIDNPSGYIGIGTDNPRTMLHIHSQKNQGNLTISGASDKGHTYSSISLDDNIPDSKNRWSIVHKNETKNYQKGDFQIARWDNSGKMRIDFTIDNPSGHIGIGTDKPNAELHVNNSKGQGKIAITGASDNGNTYSALYLHDNGLDKKRTWVISHKNRGGTESENDLHFGYFDINKNLHISMIMDSKKGYIGIGTLNPQEKLEVNGNIKASKFLESSDIRLKKNIKKITNPLEKIKHLNGIRFNWKNNNKKDILEE